MKIFNCVITFAFLIGLIIISLFYSKQPWFRDNYVILHALGTVENEALENVKMTNSKEALEENYAKGYRIFETDFLETSDGEVVLCHDWDIIKMDGVDSEHIPDYETYMNGKIGGDANGFSPMDASMLIDFVDKHPDVYIITDVKISTDKSHRMNSIEKLVKKAKEQSKESFLDHLVVQFYFKEDNEKLNEIYPFKHKIFTLYSMGFDGDYDELCEIVEFCEDNGVEMVTMWAHLWDVKYRKLFKEHHIYSAIHTLNDASDAAMYVESGVSMIYSDSLTDEAIKNEIGFIKIIKKNAKDLLNIIFEKTE